MSQEVRKEVGLEETDGKANAKARRRAGVLLSSDVDSCYGGQVDVKNHQGRAEESKLLLRMHQQMGYGQMETKFSC